jgi:DNA invertase Pin-like site-specific DNA recombinase
MFSILKPEAKKAVAYYRHSAEDKQENSVPIQREQTVKFAEQHKIEIIHEEADEGISGLTDSRPGFQRIFNKWVENPEAPPFDYIFIYDVSRLGRFQDLNVGSVYENRCTKRGKKIIYIDQGFPQEDNPLPNHILTMIQRCSAADYSRILSIKVFEGSKKVSSQGFSAGGTAPYGMQRLLLNENKEPIGTLKLGEHKVIANQRVTFTPANDETTEIIKKIFNLFVNQWETPEEIAEALNDESVPGPSGNQWRKDSIVRILTNMTYKGTRVYNKTWGRLKKKSHPNPIDEWVICDNAFPAIVSPELFHVAQERMYWLMPSRYMRGIRAINKVKRALLNDLQGILTEQSKFSEDELFQIKHQFPFSCCITYYYEGIAHWCFIISEQIKQYPKILGIGIPMDGKQSNHKLFMIPTVDFAGCNYLIFSEKDPVYHQYQIELENIPEQLNYLAQEVVS